MSESSANADSAATNPEGRNAAGAALLAERRRQGLSLGDISRQLKLSVRQVEALERDDYSGYKGPVFIHGFIRNYAKLLGLDPNPLIRATDAMLNPPAAVPVVAPRDAEPKLNPNPRQHDARAKTRVWPAVVTALVLILGISFYVGGRRSQEAGRNAPSVAAREKAAVPPKVVAEAKPVVEAKVRVEPRPEAEPAVKPAAKPEAKQEARSEAKPEAKAGTKPEVKAEITERRAPVQSSAAIAAEPAARVTVRMIFAQDSWVEIKDRSGNTIFGQLNLAGSRRSASGEPPLTVVVGNAAGVQLFQGDKSIDLAPHTRVDVARLTLN